MSASIGAGGDTGGKGGSQDFDLNLAPIIDCMTVLIAFMLASTAFLSIGILDAGVAAAGATQSSNTPPAIQVAVELGKDQAITVKVSGKVTSTTPIARAGSSYALEELARNLASLKQRFPETS